MWHGQARRWFPCTYDEAACRAGFQPTHPLPPTLWGCSVRRRMGGSTGPLYLPSSLRAPRRCMFVAVVCRAAVHVALAVRLYCRRMHAGSVALWRSSLRLEATLCTNTRSRPPPSRMRHASQEPAGSSGGFRSSRSLQVAAVWPQHGYSAGPPWLQATGHRWPNRHRGSWPGGRGGVLQATRPLHAGN